MEQRCSSCSSLSVGTGMLQMWSAFALFKFSTESNANVGAVHLLFGHFPEQLCSAITYYVERFMRVCVHVCASVRVCFGGIITSNGGGIVTEVVPIFLNLER